MKIDFNNNGVSDFNLDLKTLILIVGANKIPEFQDLYT